MPIRAERPHVGTDPVSVRHTHLSIHQDRINIRAEQGRKKSHAVGRPNWHGYRTETGSVPTCGLTAEPHNISLTLLCLDIYANAAYRSKWVGRWGLLLPVHYLSEKWREFFGHSFVLLETWMVASAVAQFARLE